MYLGIDLEQFVRDPYSSGIQRVLQYLAIAWPDDVDADFVIPVEDAPGRPAGFALLSPEQAAALLSLPFQPRAHGSDLRQAVGEHLATVSAPVVKPGDLLSVFDGWLLPEVSYLPSVLERLERFAACMPIAMIGYDVLPMSDPANYRFKPGASGSVSEYFRHLATADAVVCISGYSRDAILGRLRRDPLLPISVASPGGDHLGVREPTRAARTTFARLGTLEARKRPVEILHAFADAVREHGVDAELMFIGNPSASDASINVAVQAAVDRGLPVRWVVGAADDEVYDLIHKSSAFLSIGTEGYGIPVLEAIRLGTPVLYDGVQPAGDIMAGRGATRVAAMEHDDLVAVFRGFSEGSALSRTRAELDPESVPRWADFTAAVAHCLDA